MSQTSDDPKRAEAYVRLPREQALAAHPSLASTFQVEDKLRSAASDAKPIAPEVSHQVNQLIRASVARSLLGGRDPQVSQASLDAVRFQVAHRSMEFAAAEQLQRPDHRLELDAVHRSRLVAHAEGAMRHTTGSNSAVNALSNDKILARDIASTLATLDYPVRNNPFAEKSLSAIYDRQIQYRQFVDSRQGNQDRSSGLSQGR